MDFNIENLTADEIHKMWNELGEEERMDFFESMKDYAKEQGNSENIDLEVGEERILSDTIKVERDENGVNLKFI